MSSNNTTPTTDASTSTSSSPVKMSKFYGSTTASSVSFNFDDDDNEQKDLEEQEHGQLLSRRSSSGQFSISMIDSSNVWTSFQRNADTLQANLVPSKEAPNVQLVLDSNLEPGESGTLYYDASALYNPLAPPQYALTVHPDIYQKICQEVSDAQTTPCGFYFCCHGGDGAHTGVSGHKDSVDIRVAVAVMVVFFMAMIVIEVMDLSNLVTVSVDDDFY